MSVPKTLEEFKAEAKSNDDGQSSLMCNSQWLDCHYSYFGYGMAPAEDHYDFKYNGKKIDERTALEIFTDRPEKGRAR